MSFPPQILENERLKIELSEVKNQLREERSSLRRNNSSSGTTKAGDFEDGEGDQSRPREEGDGQASEAEAAAGEYKGDLALTVYKANLRL